MKNNKWFVGILVIALGGCGVHVGNGLKKYQSPQGFEIQYHESLTLKESADKNTVTISNENTAKGKSARAGANDSVSSVVFKIDPARSAFNAEGLQAIAAAEAPGRTFQKFTAKDSIGVKSVSEGDGYYFATYYFVTTKRALVRADVSAKSDVKNLFAPIAESFQGGGTTVPTAQLVPARIRQTVELNRDVELQLPEEFVLVRERLPVVLDPEVQIVAQVKLSAEKDNKGLITFAITPHLPFERALKEPGHSEVHVFGTRPAYFCKGHPDLEVLPHYVIQASDTKDLVVVLEGEPDQVARAAQVLGGLKFSRELTKPEKKTPDVKVSPIVPNFR